MAEISDIVQGVIYLEQATFVGRTEAA